jgi:hypothetical protein
MRRYLSPEPLLHNPAWVAKKITEGHPIAVYSYARSNPLRWRDRNGKDYSDSSEILVDLCDATEGTIEVTINSSSGEERVTSANASCKAKSDGGTSDASLGKPLDMSLRRFKIRIQTILSCQGRRLKVSPQSPNLPKDPL